MTKTYKDWSEQQWDANYELVRRGKFRHILHSGQRLFYDMIENNPDQKNFFFYASRRFGKSVYLSMYAMIFCASNNKVVARHIFPTIKNAKEIVYSIMTDLVTLLPKDMRPVLRRVEGVYYFPNGSQYKLGGAAPETIDNNRGNETDLLLFDEVAFFDEKCFESLIYSILKPQLAHSKFGITIYATTPPSTPNHPSITKLLPEIQKKGCFLKATIFDNPLISETRRNEMMVELGGHQSRAWRREFMAEFIADDSRRIVPEFIEDLHVSTEDYQLPEFGDFNDQIFYHGFVVCDYGITDGTGILAGRYDHLNNQIVVEHELMATGLTLVDLQVELDVMWNKLKFIHPEHKMEIIDMMEQAGLTFRQEYGRDYRRPSKGKLEDQSARVNAAFRENRIVIHPRCKMLIDMLNYGQWKDTEKSKEFERTSEYLHQDLVAALFYMVSAARYVWGQIPGHRDRNQLTFGNRKYRAK